MNTKTPYWRRRILWALRSWAHKRVWWHWIIELVAFSVLKTVLTLLHAIFTREPDDPFSGWGIWIQEFGAWNAIHLLFAALLVVSFEWFRSPGKMDQEHQKQIASLERSLQRLSKRHKPSIWMAGKVHINYNRILDTVSDEGASVGITVENRGNCALHDVRVELVKIDMLDFATSERTTALPVELPILLEWNPLQQDSAGISTATIPAGSSLWCGIICGDRVQSANRSRRKDLNIETRVFRREYYAVVRLTAEGISAVDSPEFKIICRQIRVVPGFNDEVSREVAPGTPFDIEPKCAVEIL